LKSSGDLQAQIHGPLDTKAALFFHHLSQRATVDELGHVEEMAILVRVSVEHLHHVRVMDARIQARFENEALCELFPVIRMGEAWHHDLDGDLRAKPKILRST